MSSQTDKPSYKPSSSNNNTCNYLQHGPIRHTELRQRRLQSFSDACNGEIYFLWQWKDNQQLNWRVNRSSLLPSRRTIQITLISPPQQSSLLSDLPTFYKVAHCVTFYLMPSLHLLKLTITLYFNASCVCVLSFVSTQHTARLKVTKCCWIVLKGVIHSVIINSIINKWTKFPSTSYIMVQRAQLLMLAGGKKML